MSDQHNPSNPNPTPRHAAHPNEPRNKKFQEIIEPSESGTLSPNDHLELLIELMRPNSIELARRWVSVLMMVPESERESIVQAVEAQIVAEYCP